MPDQDPAPTTEPATPAADAKAAAAFSPVRLGLMLLVVFLIAIVVYQAMISQPNVAGRTSPSDDKKYLGLGEPTANRLDARFTDADGDLVADAPADASALIDPDALVFSFIVSPNPEQDEATWKPFAEAIGKTVGKPVIYQAFDSRDAQLAALAKGEVHLIALNTGAVPIAVNACGLVPIASPGVEGQPLSYTMQIITPAGSDLQGVTDLAGHTVAFTNTNSNSGFKAPVVLLENDFGLRLNVEYNAAFTYGHDKSIAAIGENRYQAACVASDLLARAVREGRVKEDAYRVIYDSESFPVLVVGHVHNLKPELAASIRDAILGYDFAGSPLAEEYSDAGGQAFVAIDYKDDFALVRRIDDLSGFEHKIKAAE